MHSIRKGASHYQWEPEPVVTAWDTMTVDEKLDNVDGALRSMVRRYCREKPGEYEDMLQEARTAAWQQIDEKPDAPRHIVIWRAKRPLAGIAFHGSRYTGSRENRGHQAGRATMVDIPDNHWGDSIWEDIRAAQEFERVEMAEIETEIRSAIRALLEIDRTLVWHLFWDEMTYEQAAKAAGLSCGQARGRWQNRIRPSLSTKLEHLKPPKPPPTVQYWGPTEDTRLLALHAAGMTRAAIAREMGFGDSTVRRHWERLGLNAAHDTAVA